MPRLTSAQVSELANNFLAIAQSVGDFRYANYDTLSRAQNQKIKDMHWSILNYCDDLYSMAAVLVMDDAQNSLLSIERIANQMKRTYKQLTDIQKAINVAASVVTLGAAILSKNPQAIIDSIDGLTDSWTA